MFSKSIFLLGSLAILPQASSQFDHAAEVAEGVAVIAELVGEATEWSNMVANLEQAGMATEKIVELEAILAITCEAQQAEAWAVWIAENKAFFEKAGIATTKTAARVAIAGELAAEASKGARAATTGELAAEASKGARAATAGELATEASKGARVASVAGKHAMAKKIFPRVANEAGELGKLDRKKNGWYQGFIRATEEEGKQVVKHITKNATKNGGSFILSDGTIIAVSETSSSSPFTVYITQGKNRFKVRFSP